MRADSTALLVGGTGRTGARVLERLLSRGIGVRAIVRSADRLPMGAAHDSRLEVIVADLLSLDDEALSGRVGGCDAVISCLGHVPSFKGVFGPPRDLVTAATTRLCRAIEAAQPPSPVKFVLMSSVSVNQPAGRDARRGAFERGVLRTVRFAMPPAKDNQDAADFLCDGVGTASSSIQWVAVRPDTLREGDVSEYAVHEDLVDGLFRPGRTSMANIAHFMCRLVEDEDTWARWRGKLPVIVDTDTRRR